MNLENSEKSKYISGFSLVVSIFPFLKHMYYNGKSEGYKRILNIPYFCLIALNNHMN